MSRNGHIGVYVCVCVYVYIYIYIYTHINMSIPGPATNHCPRNSLNHKCTMECPNDHKISNSVCRCDSADSIIQQL